MASSKKITTSLTPGDEEADVNQEIKRIQKDDQNQETDLNKEPKPEEDEADVEDRDRDRKLDKTVVSALAKKEGTEKKKKKMVMDYEDVSKESKELLGRWKKPTTPKQTIMSAGNFVECSSAIRKQLTESDVSGERLVLSRSQVEKHFLPLLHESETPSGKEGIEVEVSGPDGKVHKMRMWGYDDNKTQVATGWKNFVAHYQLKEICDFITIWMLRDKHNQICFAIDCTRLSLRNQVSKRISKEFEKSDEERGA